VRLTYPVLFYGSFPKIELQEQKHTNAFLLQWIMSEEANVPIEVLIVNVELLLICVLVLPPVDDLCKAPGVVRSPHHVRLTDLNNIY